MPCTSVGEDGTCFSECARACSSWASTTSLSAVIWTLSLSASSSSSMRSSLWRRLSYNEKSSTFFKVTLEWADGPRTHDPEVRASRSGETLLHWRGAKLLYFYWNLSIFLYYLSTIHEIKKNPQTDLEQMFSELLLCVIQAMLLYNIKILAAQWNTCRRKSLWWLEWDRRRILH